MERKLAPAFVSLILSLSFSGISRARGQLFENGLFEMIKNTTFSGVTSVSTVRSIAECGVHCISTLGAGVCQSANYNPTSGSCGVTAVFVEDTALSEDTYSVTLRVIKRECGMPVIPNSILGSVNTTYGASVSITCIAGFVASTSTIVCQTSGSWTHAECIIDCGNPAIPNSNLVIGSTLSGSSITVTCLTGYVTTNNTIVCQTSGVWTAADCLKDCGGLTIPNAITSYTSGGTTYVGSTARVTCSSNYALTDKGTYVDAVCDTTGGWIYTFGVVPVCWELVFRGTRGNGYNITDIYLNGGASVDASGMTTSHALCQNVSDTTCTLHYRNPRIDTWTSLGVQQVRYEMYNGTETVMSMTIAASGSTMLDWFNYGKTNPIALPWTDIELSSTWWAIVDWDTELGRSFRVVEKYGYCTRDILYTMVVYEPWRSPTAVQEDIFCNYETVHTAWPQFLYTLNGVKSNFHVDDYGKATTMAIWVLHS